jgi:hypothetical protein
MAAFRAVVARGGASDYQGLKGTQKETTMRWLCVALVLLCGIREASADIRITVSRYENGKTIVVGETAPGRTVTLDSKYKTQSDGGGHFRFSVPYKPSTCMSDIKAADDVYSAVIAGCFGATTDVAAPKMH